MESSDRTSEQPQEDDDFFGTQHDDSHQEKQRQEREIAAMGRYHYTSGLREEAHSVREAHIQKGFDDGFAAGARSASKPAFLMGACSVIEAFYSKNGCSGSSNERSQTLDDTEVLTKDIRELLEVNASLRAELQNFPLDSCISATKAWEACEKVAVINLPSYMTKSP